MVDIGFDRMCGCVWRGQWGMGGGEAESLHTVSVCVCCEGLRVRVCWSYMEMQMGKEGES